MDKIFQKPINKQFEFDDEVASVFDDMLKRSIPNYKESIFFIAHLADKLLKPQATVIDLGCSTANTLLAIHKQNPNFQLFGYDNSSAMLEMAKKKIKAYGANIKLKEADILTLDIPSSNLVIANYMLQFIRPLQRADFIKNIYNSIEKNGYFIFSEKIIYEDKKLHKVIIDLYSEFKKTNGYSEFEIAQKREALENILIPYTQEENYKMVKNAGFKNIETILKWGNFTTYLALKE